MKSLFFIIVSLTVVFLVTHAAGQSEMIRPPRLDLVKIELTNRNQAKELDNLGVIINQVRDDYCIAEVSPSLFTTISNQGYKISTLQEDISGEYFNNFFTKSSRGRYLTYTEFIDTMHVIAANNSSICKLETLGMSHQSRLILALKISDSVDIDENEPEIYFDGNIHGDEKIGWAVCFEFVKYIMNNYGFNPVVANLVNNREIWVIPMINPDGYVNSVRYNGRSVDLNRNFGWMWGNESSCGSDAFSENEATLFYNLFVAHPFVVYTTYHAGDSIISNPWSYTSYDSVPEKFLIWHLAQGYSQRGNNYPYGQGSIVMYTINGASKDYVYGVGGEIGWSIEVHNTKTPPATAIDPTFNINRDAMLWLCHKAGQGIHGIVTDSISGESLYAQIWVLPRNWLSYSSPTKGDFHRFYLPGTYTIKVRSAGYEEKTMTVVVPNTGDSSVFVNVELNPDTNSIHVSEYGMRFVTSRYVTTSSNRTYPVRALGLHDSVAYQLDNTKWIVIDMYKPIKDSISNDFTVFRSSGTGTATVKISNNWKGPWTTVGTANAPRTSFNIGAAGFDSVRYIRLDASGTFGFDAIEKTIIGTGVEAPIFNLQAPISYNLKVHPNLVATTFKISCIPNPAQDVKFSMYDITGRNINDFNLRAGQSHCSFELKSKTGDWLKNGVYFIRTDEIDSPIIKITVIH